jgi:hypothetical protein
MFRISCLPTLKKVEYFAVFHISSFIQMKYLNHHFDKNDKNHPGKAYALCAQMPGFICYSMDYLGLFTVNQWLSHKSYLTQDVLSCLNFI